MRDRQGGEIPNTVQELERAARVDLVTLPVDIAGTNCGNCIHFMTNWCWHPKVQQAVTNRQCCALWNALGTLRSWE